MSRPVGGDAGGGVALIFPFAAVRTSGVTVLAGSYREQEAARSTGVRTHREVAARVQSSVRRDDRSEYLGESECSELLSDRSADMTVD